MFELILAVVTQTITETDTTWDITLDLYAVHSEIFTDMATCELVKLSYEETSIITLEDNQLVMITCKPQKVKP